MKHLPECPKAIIEPTLYYCGIPLSKSDSVCICSALRACEQRVMQDAYADGCTDALDAAEQAVKNYQHDYESTLAAIRKLREEK